MATRKRKEDTKGYQKRQAVLLRKKQRQQEVIARKQANQQASKMAMDAIAEEAFGEGGLTPERKAALSAVILGPESGHDLMITAPNVLRKFIKDAREKFLRHAERYVDIHLHATQAALSSGEFETAGRMSQWAMEAFSEEEDRVVYKESKTALVQLQQPKVIVSVPLGNIGRK